MRRYALRATVGAIVGLLVGLALAFPFEPYGIQIIAASTLIGAAVGVLFGGRPLEVALRVAAWLT